MRTIVSSLAADALDLAEGGMTIRGRRPLLCLACAMLVAMVRPAHAADATWDGSQNTGTWSDTANWTPATTPGTGNTATFNNAGGTVDTIDVTGVTSINTILFDTAAAAAYTIGSGGASVQTLTLDNGGAITKTSTASAIQTINSDLILGAANSTSNFTITNNNASNLNIAGTVTGFAGANVKTLIFDGIGVNNIANGSGGANGVGGILNTGGVVAVVMNGAGGTLMMGGNGGVNNYTGGTWINAGTFQVISTSNLPNASALYIADGTTFAGVNPPAKNWTGMTQQWNGDFRSAGTAVTFAGGTVNLGATGTDITRTISTVAGGISSIGDVIANGSNGLTNSLHVNGTLTLSNNNLYTGATTVSNGTLTLSGSNAYTGPTTVNSGTLSITGTNPSTGTATITSGTLNLSGSGTLAAPTAYVFNGNSNLTLTNTTPAQAALVRVSTTAPITATGNVTLTNTNTSGNTYSQTFGDVTLTGQLNAVLTNNMAVGSQVMTLTSLTRATPTSAVTFSAGITGPNATSNQIVVGGGGTTAAGQIVGPWATVGTTAALQTDYAVYTSDVVGAAGIVNSAEGTWTGGATGNYTSTSTTNTLTGDRTMNSWRYSAAAGALTLGANNFDTNGILNGGSGLLTISAAGGALRQQGTAAGNFFINAGNNNITITAPIQNNTGALTLVKAGSGTLTLTTANSSTGGVVFNAGNLVLGNTTSLGTGTLTFNGGSIGNTGTTTPVPNNNAMIWNGDVNYQSGITGGINLGTGAITLNNIVKVSNATGLGFVIGGNISGSGGLIVTGRSTWNGTGTFTGNTIVTAGNASFANLTLQNSALDTAGNVAPTFSGTTPTLGGFLGANPFVTPANVTSLTLNLATGVTHKYAGALSGGTTMAVTKIGLGTQIFAGENTYTGATTINAGTLSIKTIQDAGNITPNALGRPAAGANSIIGLANNTTLQYTGFMSGSSNRVVNLTTAAGGTFTLDAGGSTPFALSGGITTAGTSGTSTLALTGSGAGSESGTIVNGTGTNITALAKSGSGTWTLSGNNSYTGNTTISLGTLALSNANNNNIAGTPLITLAPGASLDTTGLGGAIDLLLASGQTLRGTGTVVGNLTVGLGSTIAPGNSPGTMNHNGDETWDVNGNYQFEINDVNALPGTGIAGNDPGWDLMAMIGTLTISATNTNPFEIELVGLTLGNAVGVVNDFNNTATYAWMIADSGPNVIGYAPDKFLIDDTQFVSANPYGGTFNVVLGSSVGGDDSQVWLTYSANVEAVPEPGTFILAALGLVGLGCFAWRRRRRT